MANEKDLKTSYTPSADAKNVAADETPKKKGLGTGAIVGIVAAGVVLLAGAFGTGLAVAAVTDHAGRPGDFAVNGQMQGGQRGIDPDGDNWTSQNRMQNGQPGQMPGGQMPGGQMPGGQMPGGQMPGGQRGIDPDGDNWTGQNRMQNGQQNPQQNPQAPAPAATSQTQTN